MRICLGGHVRNGRGIDQDDAWQIIDWLDVRHDGNNIFEPVR